MRKSQHANKTVNYELFHSADNIFYTSLKYGFEIMAEDIRSAFLKGQYELVHTFERSSKSLDDELERIFFESQNLDESWRGDNPCRSTSVGDVVRAGDDYWIVAQQGFELGWRDERGMQ